MFVRNIRSLSVCSNIRFRFVGIFLFFFLLGIYICLLEGGVARLEEVGETSRGGGEIV